MEERIKISNRKGQDLDAILHYPDQADKVPGVIVLHGFGGFKEEQHIEAIAKSLCAAHMLAIRFDASGFGGSDGSAEKDFRVSNYLNDVEDVFQFAGRLPAVNKSRFGIVGHSLGAMLALIFTAKTRWINACCALQPPTTLMRRDGRRDFENWQKTGWYEMTCDQPLGGIVRLPWEFVEDSDQFDALNYVQELTVPTAIMIGTEDLDVKPENTMLLYEAATNCPKELIKLDGFTHDFKNHPDQLRLVVDRTIQFFRKTLL